MVPGYQWNHGSGWFWLQASPYQGFSEVQGSLKGDANWNLKYCLNFVFCWKNGGKHGDDYLEFNEFRIFLATLRQYFEYFEAFKRYKLLLNIRNDQIEIEVKHFGERGSKNIERQTHWCIGNITSFLGMLKSHVLERNAKEINSNIVSAED